MITPKIESRDLNDPNFLLAKALDNRIGVALALEVLDNLQHESPSERLLRRRRRSRRRSAPAAPARAPTRSPRTSASPLDVTIAHDYPGGTKEAELGKGPCLMIYDSSMVGHVGLRTYAIRLCEELSIPYQLSYLRQGGTDAGKMHLTQNGCPSIAICLASRYIHSHTSIIHAARL
ncbi:MAG: hypothetical protein MZW92_02465 [Comamonadaceae bacterium]|nr:hypothetical protein [Comamonadaceae bacterium]